MVRCDGDSTRSKLLALSVVLLTAAVFAPSASAETAEETEYWCYGDSVTLSYDGSAENVEWTVSYPDGGV